ncbi:hypothetical protein DAPPUDRAFT_340729 [Daphnia pulex]|uniref:Uncharacterized protein n=1 Tax=Daphnia pulex TaxID=6669 RepID=E9I4N2_DAPPU|nr:hypothetical protein DAPPUDRAFT_340729 [Daphnia pulex]|eukprot:EFX61050.1 hypothetical protein DAPPUDRAFT_340729 [Daphnia pulex]
MEHLQQQLQSLKEQLEQLKGPENQGRRIEILRQIRDVDQQILDTLREDTARRRRENENLRRALDLQEKMAAMRKHK